MLDGLSKLLSLTTDQVASMKTILTASDATLQPLMKTASDAGKALHDAVFAADYEATAVADLTTEALTAQGNVIDASVAVWAQIRAVLTADQFAILAAGPGPGCPPRGGQRPLGQQSGTNRR
jgi:Spy/CpxP family protein refolding chaperone